VGALTWALCLAVAQDNSSIRGRWSARLGSADSAEIIFQFSVGADGRIQGTFSVPRMSVEAAPITSVTMNGREVRLRIGGLQSDFDGTLDPAGAVIDGTLRRDAKSIPIRLTLIDRKLEVRPEAKPAPREVVEWFRSAAIRLRTTTPGEDLDDLQPLRELIGSARIVSMGEATHGTREFFQLKHRILEFLVSEMGFTVFAIEANWPESLALNRYVLTGEGDPVQVLNGLHFWTCNSQEVLDMVLWMRHYNEDPAHGSKVKFFGFDMQYAMQGANGALDYLRRVDSETAKAFASATETLRGRGDVEIWEAGLSDDQRRQIAATAAEFLQRFDSRKQQYVARSSEAEWNGARQQMTIVRQAATITSGADRDRFMAEDAKWILDQEPVGTKMMLWAHNGHAQTSPGPDGQPKMGMHLRRMYGDAIVTLGFAFNQGEFRSFGIETKRLQSFTLRPAPVGSLDASLAAAGLPLFLVDLRRAPKTGVVGEWLAQQHGSREIGGTYNPEVESTYQAPLRITQAFDLLLFVERTSAAKAVAQQQARPYTTFASIRSCCFRRCRSKRLGTAAESWSRRKKWPMPARPSMRFGVSPPPFTPQGQGISFGSICWIAVRAASSATCRRPGRPRVSAAPINRSALPPNP
jgi:erythromycin esterase